MDGDGNGTLSMSELGDAMTALGVSYTVEELSGIMKEMDTNGKHLFDDNKYTKELFRRSAQLQISVSSVFEITCMERLDIFSWMNS